MQELRTTVMEINEIISVCSKNLKTSEARQTIQHEITAALIFSLVTMGGAW